MNCEQSANLFDSYLDGELSSTLETELLSHLVDCSDCRRSLAILEVAGHVIKTDSSGPQLTDSFSDRLLACMAEEPSDSYVRFRKVVRWGLIGLGAAAAVVFAVGAFSGRPSLIAGSREKVSTSEADAPQGATELRASEMGRRGVNRPTWDPVEKPQSDGDLDMDDWSRMTVMQLLNALGLESPASENGPTTHDEPEPRLSPADSPAGSLVEEF